MSNSEKLEHIIQDILSGHSIDKLEIQYGNIDLNEAGKLGRTPLMVAAALGLLQVAEFLMRRGASVQIAGIRDLTPLHEASSNGQITMVSYFLGQGAQVDSMTTDDVTPLMCAAAWGNVEVLQLLLANGADWTKIDRTGSTASEIAREKNEDLAAEIIDSFANSKN